MSGETLISDDPDLTLHAVRSGLTDNFRTRRHPTTIGKLQTEISISHNQIFG
jgi:hypothetical protein